MNLVRVLPLSVCLLLLLIGGHARSDEGYIADKNGCKIANPSPKPSETVAWSGGCKDGFADGNGIMQWYDQDSRARATRAPWSAAFSLEMASSHSPTALATRGVG